MAGVALAQNPFRDLAPIPEPEPQPTRSTPITIDIPNAPLPAPPTSIDGFPALPAPGAMNDNTLTTTAAPAKAVNIPNQSVILALPELNTLEPEPLEVTLRSPLLTPTSASIHPLLEPLPTPEPAREEMVSEPKPTEETDLWCEDAAVLATSGGQAPSALIRCGSATHLLRVGDTLPGTDATIKAIDSLGVTIARHGEGHHLHMATD